MPPSLWIEELQSLLDAGARYVITEGRDSATAGIYRPSGEVREGLLEDILIALDHKRIIFEAPTPKTQMFFINLVGSDVNLGNVAISDLLLLETQRRALRYETFFLKH
jgi:phosphosulfolactate synthase